MAKHKRINVTEEIQRIELHEIPDKLEDFIKQLKAIKSTMYTDITIGVDGPEYEGADTIVISGKRLENDKEYDARVERWKKFQLKKKQDKMNVLQKTELRILQLQKEAEKLREQTKDEPYLSKTRLQSV